MSHLISGATPCQIAPKEVLPGRKGIYYCKTHNETYLAHPGHKKCPFGRKGKRAKMWVWSEAEVKEALK